MSNKLKSLIKKWAELEPDKCKIDSDFLGTVRLQRGNEVFMALLFIEGEPAASYDILQSVLQQAIRERCWACFISTENGDEWTAIVKYASESRQSFAGTEREPAIALLEAYVLCLDQNDRIGSYLLSLNPDLEDENFDDW